MDRNLYLDKLVQRKHNGLIKVITGIRRVGKSYLLFNLFYSHLLKEGVDEDHIIKIPLDDRINKEYRDPDKLINFVRNKVKDDGDYYVLLDEVQMVPEFEDVLNSFLHIPNVDTYVTGSNAKFLSKDIITEFRGRGDQIHILPLSFAEYMQARTDSPRDAWYEYTMYGGLPKLLDMKNEEDKADYLNTIFSETYLKDILDRNDVRNPTELDELLNYLASSTRGLTNPKKLSDTFKSLKNVSIHPDTTRIISIILKILFWYQKHKDTISKAKNILIHPSNTISQILGLEMHV